MEWIKVSNWQTVFDTIYVLTLWERIQINDKVWLKGDTSPYLTIYLLYHGVIFHEFTEIDTK